MTNIILYCALSALITSVVSIVFGWGQINTNSIIMFTVLSLIIPILLRKHPRGQATFRFPLHLGLYSYSWIGWSLFFYVGNAIVPISLPEGGPFLIGLVWTIVMAIANTLMIITGIVLTVFFNRERRFSFVDEVIDVAVYTLPIPMLLLGDVLFEKLDGLQMIPQIANMIMTFISLIVYALVIITMLAFVIYLYPREGISKGPRFTRIIVTAVLWIAINAHIVFGGYIPPWVIPLIEKAMPVFSGSILVYITPSVIQLAVLSISMGIGYAIERFWVTKKNNI